MKTYLLDFSEKKLDESESIDFFRYSINEMSKKDINVTKYLEIENNYIEFFKILFELNNSKVKIVFRDFEFDFIKEWFKNERELFIKFLFKLSFDNIFFKKYFEVTNFEYFKSLIKLSYRNFNASSWLKMEYEELQITVFSLYDYCYTINLKKESFILVSKILKKLNIYLKDY